MSSIAPTMTQPTPHYFVITLGSNGDLYPFMCLAKALLAMGRKVTFISVSYYQNVVERAGIPFIGVGTDEEFLSILRNPDIWDPKKGFAAILANYSVALTQGLQAIQSNSTQGQQVVIAHPFAVPVAAIAQALGLVQTVVAVYLAPSNLKTCYDPLNLSGLKIPTWLPMAWRRVIWRLIEKGWIDPVAVPQINKVRAQLGLANVEKSFLDHIADTPQLSVALFPAWFGETKPDWPQPMIAGNFQLFEANPQTSLSDEVAAFLQAGEKPYIVTAGTGNWHAAEFFRRVLAALKQSGHRAIFLSKERAQIPETLPETILWQPYVPLSALLPHAAGIIHHGGIGTTAEALRAGIPQLITPFAWDQFDNAARIVALGVDKSIPVKKLTPSKLAKALQTLAKDEKIETQCKSIAWHFVTEQDPIRLCREIERLIR